jgi:serine/threonine protein kinase, bacterial
MRTASLRSSGERRVVTEVRFGPYRLEELIGRGGMGEVFRAYDTSKRRIVALKRLPAALANDPQFQARFRREAEVAARLREPHIVPIHDFGEIDGQLFIDMRLIEGTDLAALIAEFGPLPGARAVDIVAQLARALQAAHDEGLVHRDIKPSNVLISGGSREEDFVYLVDFGLARTSTSTTLTAAGAAPGTISYMAPERLLTGRCDLRADIYSMGCLLYESLTGRKPFLGDGLEAQMYAHVHVPPPRPSDVRTDLPPDLDIVVSRAMAKDPDQRYRSASDFADAAFSAVRAEPADVGLTAAAPSRSTCSPPTISEQLSPQPRFPHGARPQEGRHAERAIIPPTLVPGDTADERANAVTHVPADRARSTAGGRRNSRRRLRTTIAAVVGLVGLVAAVVLVANRTGKTDAAAGRDPTLAVATTVRVGDYPTTVAVTPDGKRAYVTNQNSGSVSVVDTESNVVVASIQVGSVPWGVAITPDGRRAYVTNCDSRSVSVIDTQASSVVKAIDVGECPTGLTVTPDGRAAYVANNQSSSVSVIDSVTDAVTATIAVGDHPSDVAITPDGRYAYTTSSASNSVSVIDTAAGTARNAIVVGAPGSWIEDFTITPDGRRAYVAFGNWYSVAVVDLSDNATTATIRLGKAGEGVAIGPDGRQAYVTTGASLSVINTDTNAISTTVQLDGYPRGVAISPDGRHAYVSDYSSNLLWAVDISAG